MPARNFYIYTVLIVCLFFVSNSFAIDSNDLPYAADRILVKFAPKVGGILRTANEQNQILSSVDAGTVKKSLKLVPGLTVVELPNNASVVNILAKLKEKGEILYAEPDWKISIQANYPDDQGFSGQWGLDNTGQGGGVPDADIDAPEAWDVNTACTDDIIVAVIDTGAIFYRAVAHRPRPQRTIINNVAQPYWL
jgi:hypothetical protein